MGQNAKDSPLVCERVSPLAGGHSSWMIRRCLRTAIEPRDESETGTLALVWARAQSIPRAESGWFIEPGFPPELLNQPI